MEKTIVIYKSKYGASAQYAAWIAEELGCRAVSIDEFKKNDLKENIIKSALNFHNSGKKDDKTWNWKIQDVVFRKD